MTKECYNPKPLIDKLSKQDKPTRVPRHYDKAMPYVKRSIELGKEGYQNTIVFNKAGDIAAAAAFEGFKGGLRVETLGSIGNSIDGVSPGMLTLYNIYKAALNTKTGIVTLWSTPEAMEFYEHYGFKHVGPGSTFNAVKEDYLPFIDFIESKEGFHDIPGMKDVKKRKKK